MTDGKKPTLIWTEIDLDKDGKQVGVLQLPYSVTRSGYGMIDIPMAVIRNGEGPSILLMAGNHGDEYEGQVTLARLIHDLEGSDIRGRVIVMPAANLPAAMASARVSPLDSGNLNRAFPGEPDASPTWQIAHYIDSVLVPICSAWLDLHSGGSSMEYLPFAGFLRERRRGAGCPRRCHHACLRRSAKRAGNGETGSKVSGGDRPPAKNPVFRRRMGRRGFGQPRRGSADAPWRTAGIGPFRACCATIDRFEVPPAEKTQFLEWGGYDYYAFAPEAGLFEPVVRLGDRVKDGQLCGHVHFIESPWRSSLPVHFRKGGLLICQRHFGRVVPGDCVAHTVIAEH